MKLVKGDRITITWQDPVTYLGWFADSEVPTKNLTLAVSRGFFISKKNGILRYAHGTQLGEDAEWEDIHVMPMSLVKHIKRE